jgi:hypothetical protein
MTSSVQSTDAKGTGAKTRLVSAVIWDSGICSLSSVQLVVRQEDVTDVGFSLVKKEKVFKPRDIKESSGCPSFDKDGSIFSE